MTKKSHLSLVQHINAADDERQHNLVDRKKRQSRGRAIGTAAVVAAVAVAAVPFAVKKGAEQASEDINRADRLEQDAQEMTRKGELTISSDVVVLGEGVRLRSSPHRSVPNSDPGEDPIDVHNIVHTVEPGTRVLSDRPLQYVDEDSETWIGFNFIDRKHGTSNLVWANTSALMDQEDNSISGEDLVSFHPTDSPVPGEYAAFMGKDGKSVVHIGDMTNTELFAIGEVVQEANLNETLQTLKVVQ